MSAPAVANRDRNASGIWSRKSLIDGWSRMLGQIAAYMSTSRTTATTQPPRLRRWSWRVLRATLCSIVLTPAVVGEEGLLELGLGAREVAQRELPQCLDDAVEGGLRGVTGQRVVDHGQLADPV